MPYLQVLMQAICTFPQFSFDRDGSIVHNATGVSCTPHWDNPDVISFSFDDGINEPENFEAEYFLTHDILIDLMVYTKIVNETLETEYNKC